jgi:hypothetical protein
VGADQGDVDAPGDQRLKRRVVGGLAEDVEAAVLQVGDARREAEAEQGAQREDVLGIAAAVGVVARGGGLAPVVEQAVEDVDGLARGRRDDLRVERGVAVGEVGVELGARRIKKKKIEAGSVAAGAAGAEELAVRR